MILDEPLVRQPIVVVPLLIGGAAVFASEPRHSGAARRGDNVDRRANVSRRCGDLGLDQALGFEWQSEGPAHSGERGIHRLDCASENSYLDFAGRENAVTAVHGDAGPARPRLWKVRPRADLNASCPAGDKEHLNQLVHLRHEQSTGTPMVIDREIEDRSECTIQAIKSRLERPVGSQDFLRDVHELVIGFVDDGRRAIADRA